MTHLQQSKTIFAQKDVLAGSIFMIIGGGTYYLTGHLSHGSMIMIGSGFMPHIVSILLFLFGLVVFIGGLRRRDAAIEIVSLRPLFVVVLCVGVFAATLERIGLVSAILLVVGLSTLAGQKVRIIPLSIVAICLAAACVLIFVWGAKLPIKAGPF